MKRLLAALLSCIILLGALAACGKSDVTKDSSSVNEESTLSETEALPSGQKKDTNGKEDTGQGTGEQKEKGSSPEIINAEGIYVGQIDSHSIEITVDGKPMALQHGEELISALDKLSSDDKVTFSYYENEYGQLVLTKIDKVADK